VLRKICIAKTLFSLYFQRKCAGTAIATYLCVRGSRWAARKGVPAKAGGANSKGGIMFRKTFTIAAAAAALAFGMLVAEPAMAAQSSAPCAVPGSGPRDGSGQGQGLRDGAGNGPRNGQGYGTKRGQAKGLRDGSGKGAGMKQGRGRGLTRRDGSCLNQTVQPGTAPAINQ